MSTLTTLSEGALVPIKKGHEFRRIVSYFNRKKLLIFTMCMAVLSGGSFLLVLIINKKGVELFMNAAQFLEETKKMVKTGAWVSSIMIVIQIVSASLQMIVAPLFVVDIRKKLYMALMRADIAFFDRVSTGVMVGRLSEGVSYIRDVYIDKLFVGINAIALSFGGFIIAMVYGWDYTLEFIIFPIAIGLVLWGGNKIADKVYDKFKEAGLAAQDKATSVVTEFRTVKSFDQEVTESNKFRDLLKDEEKIQAKVSLVRALTKMFAMILLATMFLVFNWYMMKELTKDGSDLDFFGMSCVIQGVIMLALGIYQALTLSDEFSNAQEAAQDICTVIEMKPSIPPDQGRDIGTLQGNIEFRDVGFKYYGCENWALRHLNIKMDAGKTYAFVGESGCGKSTSLQLLQRFYDIQEGAILIDGIDIREMTPRSLRKNISIVPQSPVLFTMTIADNIKYGRINATDEEVARAAVTGNAHNFIMELPDNYKTMVAQTALSGGQKQRICISRSILSPTPILLLDEATAALDTESEQLVQQSLEQFRNGRTTIMVAHRLSTVVNADEIFVYQDGHIAETGTHKELLAKNGIYSALAKFQLE